MVVDDALVVVRVVVVLDIIIDSLSYDTNAIWDATFGTIFCLFCYDFNKITPFQNNSRRLRIMIAKNLISSK